MNRFLTVCSGFFVAVFICYAGMLCAESKNDSPYGFDSIPMNARGIDPEEHLGAYLPLETRFTDSANKEASLREFLPTDKPTLITFNYTNCPGLCIAQLDGLGRVVDDLKDFSLGEDYHLVSINIDPRDDPSDAASKKQKFSGTLDDRHDRSAWHFLTGKQSAIDAICESSGFRYTYDPKSNQFNHTAVLIAVSPKGKITRYLYTVGFEPATVKMSLIEASEGLIGSPLDKFLLWCYHYDAEENRYSADARRLLSFAAGAFLLLVLGGTAPFWFARRSANALEKYRSQFDEEPVDQDESPSDANTN